MQIRPRFTSVACICLGLLTGILPPWAILMALVNARVAAQKPTAPTPNPAIPPGALLDPHSALVYAEPWFAGTIGIWWLLGLLVFGAVTLIVVTLIAVALPRRTKGEGDALPLRPRALYFLSLLLGCIFAAPWIYGIIRMVTVRP